MSEENKAATAQKIAGTIIIILNLILTICVLRHFYGFWKCTGAFFLFMIAGCFAGAIGMAIGCGIAGNDNNAALKYSILGIIIGSIAGSCGVAKFVYGVNYIALLTM